MTSDWLGFNDSHLNGTTLCAYTSKSSCPDGIPGKLLQSLANELAPVLRFIFEQSLLTGDLLVDWTRANVAPIFKKGSKLQTVNYRPVSLTYFWLFSLVSNCSPSLLVYCIFLGPRGETVALVRYHRRVLK